MYLKFRRLFLEMIFLYGVCNGRYDSSDVINKLSCVVPIAVMRLFHLAAPMLEFARF